MLNKKLFFFSFLLLIFALPNTSSAQGSCYGPYNADGTSNPGTIYWPAGSTPNGVTSYQIIIYDNTECGSIGTGCGPIVTNQTITPNGSSVYSSSYPIGGSPPAGVINKLFFYDLLTNFDYPTSCTNIGQAVHSYFYIPYYSYTVTPNPNPFTFQIPPFSAWGGTMVVTNTGYGPLNVNISTGQLSGSSSVGGTTYSPTNLYPTSCALPVYGSCLVYISGPGDNMTPLSIGYSFFGNAHFTEANAGDKNVPIQVDIIAPTCSGQSGDVSVNPSSFAVGSTGAVSASAGWTGVTYSSSNSGVASVNGSQVTGVSAGGTTISGTGIAPNGAESCNLSPASITVTNAPPPPDFTLDVSPPTISITTSGAAGSAQVYTITLGSVNNFVGTVNLSVLSGCPSSPASCSLQHTSLTFNPGDVSKTTTLTVNPGSGSSFSNGNYTITVRGISGALTRQDTGNLNVNVPVPPPPPTVTLSASPDLGAPPLATTLTWTTTNMSGASCTASNGWSGSKGTTGTNNGGNENVSGLMTNTVFDISCTNAGGTANASVAVFVTGRGGGGGCSPVVNGGVGPWSECVGGTRTRECNNPAPSCGGINCTEPLSESCSMPQLNLNINRSGCGTVASNVGGISCGLTCNGTVEQGSSVTLTASPFSQCIFTGWSDSSGTCSGTNPICNFTMNSSRTIQAQFILRPFQIEEF